MKGSRRIDNEQLEKELLAKEKAITEIKSNLEEALGRIKWLEMIRRYSEHTFTYYTNPNTLHPAEYLEWKRQ